MFEFPKYDANWEQLALACKHRDGFRCVKCGGTRGALHAHHRIPKSQGGPDTLENLITLCTRCHALHHTHMKQKSTRGKSHRNGVILNWRD